MTPRARTLIAFASAILGALVFAGSPHGADKVARLGFVDLTAPGNSLPATAEFWKRLDELGWTEGRNLVVERRFAEGQIDQLPALMASVVARNIDVLVTWGSGAVAAKQATRTVPIVAADMGDPIGTGLASSLAHPGSNLTGLSLQWDEEVSGKWLELLQEAVPRLSTIAVIHNPDTALAQRLLAKLSTHALTRHLKLLPVEVRDAKALAPAFKQAAARAQAVLLLPDPLIAENGRRIVALMAENRLPDISGILEFAQAGGLMAYGVDQRAVFRRTAEYVNKILRGARPDDLPIEQPRQFLLVINLITARALRLTIPQSLLQRADDVIR
jgi:putative ABC transport system substrate-binding protein